jgi:hypothetical protein
MEMTYTLKDFATPHTETVLILDEAFGDTCFNLEKQPSVGGLDDNVQLPLQPPKLNTWPSL